MVRDTSHDSVHLFGAICAERGIGAAIIMPAVNTEAMNEHLMEISTQVAPGAHAVLVLDGAGWHQTGGRLCVPDNITLMHLPPYAPELNPVENVCEYLRANKLCNLVWDTPTTPLLKHAEAHGSSWSMTSNASGQSAHANGHRSEVRSVGIRRSG
jgi:transposase